jgi:hypothetical protein
MHAVPQAGTAIWEMSGTEVSEGHCLSLRPLYFGKRRSISRAKMGRVSDSPHSNLQVGDGSVLSAVPPLAESDASGVVEHVGSAEQCILIALLRTGSNTKPLAGFRQGRVEDSLRSPLAVASDRAQLSGQEMVGWPGAADRYLAVF